MLNLASKERIVIGRIMLLIQLHKQETKQKIRGLVNRLLAIS